ncbi:potassium transporter Kup [Candidatus Saccharibacteria bacterium RIFCSPHIGHO2_12_FULL_41_12]|nr:MAG: potassium transporter Kup [Candidatus Saccharibacteria bacterium RIFCSPHIGHO2_12_FULL_41_12]
MINKQPRWLIIGALGVVFGDIGTSPLYALQAIFGTSNLSLTPQDITGIISLIIWAVTLVVTIKYIGLIMRANNQGEGGTMALVGLLRQTHLSQKHKVWLSLLGLLGVSLFYGDSIITPAISVLSAVEGTKLIIPELSRFIIPATLVILAGLFILQSRGTGTIGKLFGPIMVLWFVTSGAGGLAHIIQQPAVLTSLLPTTAISFFYLHPLQGFIAMGAVILAVTGTEALYADMGHFGRNPIKRAWLWLVFPALALNYLGQGALIIQNPESIKSSYFLLFPPALQLPVIILATLATLIASQAVISGAFSLTRQAVQFGFAPRIVIKHTSNSQFGQIYIPALNWLIASLVMILVVSFGSSKNLGAAFGMACSGTLIVSSILLLIVMRAIWRQNIVIIACVGTVLLSIDALFVTSTSSKFVHGAWLPIFIAGVSFTLLSTWYKANRIISHERHLMEGTLQKFVTNLHKNPVERVAGHAVYLGQHSGNAPLALHASLEQLHELHENIIIVTVETTNTPHVEQKQRVTVDELGYQDDGISHITLRFGFKDTPNVPKALEMARSKSPEANFDPYGASYFISRSKPVIKKNKRLAKWRKYLYLMMDRNSTSPTDFFKLPVNRTIEMRSYIEL